MSRRLDAANGLLGRRTVLVAALALAAAACASGHVQQTAQPLPGGWTSAGLVEYAAAANNEDIQEAQLALVKGLDPAVKDFARHMITDDDAVSRRLAPLLTRLGVAGTIAAPTVQSAAPAEEVTGAMVVPPEPNEAGVAALHATTTQALARLNSLSGGAFDASYIAHQIREHQALLFALDGTLLPNAREHDVREFLETLRPIVEEHLARARELNKSLGG